MTRRQILVTAALPYANGPIHIGHLVEYIQTDIWVRFQRLMGNRCVFVWADDTHGTAIMISAKKAGVREEEFIAKMNEEHQRDFQGFKIAYDNYGSTNSPDNLRLCQQIWKALKQEGYIVEADVSQLYDPVAGTFLADRFVKGTCPKCHSANQYGDSCDKCGSTYSPSDLIDPVSTLSGSKPETRSSKHLFVQLEKLHDFLNEWSQTGDRLQTEVANYLRGHFLNEPLRDWDVSRPAPYFGFEIPDSPGNYWYVWFDAPVGYMASLAEWCRRTGEKFDDWWPQGPDAESRGPEIHHFIGKDITYFHTLFWPGMLKAAQFKLPAKVHIHGFLTVGGEKMSKSKGTFVKAQTFLKHLDPSALRYYYASKLGSRLDDIDMNLDEFAEKVDDVVNKVVNIASRCAKFVQTSGLSPQYPQDNGLFEHGAQIGHEIAAAYEACEYARAIRAIMELADRANVFIDSQKPWVIAKDPTRARELQDCCSVGLNLYRQIIIYLAPVLPTLAEQSGELLNDAITSWNQAQKPLVGTPVAPFRHLMKRIDRKDVEAMIEASKEAPTTAESTATPAATPPGDSDECLKAEPLAPVCTIEDFAKVDLRVARVIAAEDVPEADKLLKLTLSLGGEERRTVFAGIKKAYKPEQLLGRQVIVVANLAPRKMKFGLSEGMIVATGPGGSEVFLLNADQGAKVGQRVH